VYHGRIGGVLMSARQCGAGRLRFFENPGSAYKIGS